MERYAEEKDMLKGGIFLSGWNFEGIDHAAGKTRDEFWKYHAEVYYIGTSMIVYKNAVGLLILRERK